MISRTKSRYELRHVLVTFQSAKALDGFEDCGGGPSQHHLATTPPLDVPLHMPSTADQTLNRVGGGERLPKAIREPEGDDGERLVESFADARRSTRIAILDAPPRISLERFLAFGDSMTWGE